MAVRTYDPNKVSVVLGGKLVTGFGSDTFITVSRDEDLWQKMMGVDGVGARAKTNNYAGTIVLTLLHTSPANALLQALSTADEQSNTGVVPFLMRDTNGSTLVTAVSVWVKKSPDIVFSKAVTERVWTLDSDNVQLAVGANA